MTRPRADLFRAEAIDSYVEGASATGPVLRLPPAWIDPTYWLLVAVVLAAGVYISVGTIHEYASGPAIVRAEGRTDLTALVTGTVASIGVHPGVRVAVGDVLVRFNVGEEAAMLERLTREIDLQIMEVLRSPANQPARQALITLRAERTLAQARLEERTIRAPHAGVVRDIRIRPGQQLEPGQRVLSLIADDSRFVVVAMLPGQYRPLLRRGVPVRLELSGYRYAYQHLTLDAVGDEVVGPAEVRRYLGDEIGDAVPIGGPTIIVRTALSSRTFVADGRTLEYYDGMTGLAEARVREESILFTLVPGLRVLLGDGGA